MKIELRRIVRPVRLCEYAEEYGAEVIHVWVNPSRAKRLELQALGEASMQARDRLTELADQNTGDLTDDERQRLTTEAEELAEEFDRLVEPLYAWYADIWSQHDDKETHWTPDDVTQLVQACMDADPALWSWLQDETLRLMREHRDGVKKKIVEDGLKLWAHRRTDNPYFASILLAEKINRLSGGAVIAPWDVNDLPDDWLDAFAEMEKRLD